MTTSIVQDFINSIPDKRIARAFSEIFARITPSKLDTGLTAHAGGTKAAALALKSTCSFHDVTTVGSAADSILLPPAKEGEFHFVKNSAATNAMQVFGQGTDTIDSVATGTGVSQLAGDGVMYYCLVPGNWLRIGGVSATEVFTTITATTGNITTVNATTVDTTNIEVTNIKAKDGTAAIVITDATGAVAVSTPLTAASIAGGDSSLGVDGQAAAQGGAIVITGGTSSTAANAGGAVTITGGTPGAEGVGGGITFTAGAGGATSGNGGAALMVGGAATNGNGNGGLSRIRGGAGQGSGTGGITSILAGAGGATGAGGNVTILSGIGGATSGVSGDVSISSNTTTAGSGSATGSVTIGSGAGAASAVAVAGGASGAVIVRTEAGGANTGGATGEAGGAAGSLSVTGGAGGATNSAGAHAGGAGSDVSITAGAGGNATAGTGNGGAGGTIAMTPGAGGTSAGGTAGVDGTVRLAGQVTQKFTVTAMTTTAAITVAALRGGMITANQGGGAAATYTTPTGAEIAAAMPTDFTTGDAFDFTITNISTNAAEDVTVAAGASGITLVGNMTVASNDAVGSIAAGQFRVLCTGAATYSVYRIS